MGSMYHTLTPSPPTGPLAAGQMRSKREKGAFHPFCSIPAPPAQDVRGPESERGLYKSPDVTGAGRSVSRRAAFIGSPSARRWECRCGANAKCTRRLRSQRAGRRLPLRNGQFYRPTDTAIDVPLGCSQLGRTSIGRK